VREARVGGGIQRQCHIGLQSRDTELVPEKKPSLEEPVCCKLNRQKRHTLTKTLRNNCRKTILEAEMKGAV
jgi:hypothetical protein